MSDFQFNQKTCVALKVESTPGTYASPGITTSTDALEVGDLKIDRDVDLRRELNYQLSRVNNNPFFKGKRFYKVSLKSLFKFEADYPDTGGGTPTRTYFAFESILRACLQCDLGVLSDIGYYDLAQATKDIKLSIEAYEAGRNKVQIKGAVPSSCKIKGLPGEEYLLEVEFLGIVQADETSVAMPVPVYWAPSESPLVSKLESAYGIANETVEEWELDLGIKLGQINSGSSTDGIAEFFIAGWDPQITFKTAPKHPDRLHTGKKGDAFSIKMETNPAIYPKIELWNGSSNTMTGTVTEFDPDKVDDGIKKITRTLKSFNLESIRFLWDNPIPAGS